MNRIIDFVKRLFIRNNILKAVPGEYFINIKECYKWVILSVPDANYKYYDIHVYHWDRTHEHTTITTINLNIIHLSTYTTKEKYSIQDFLYHINSLIDYNESNNHHISNLHFRKVIIRLESEAIKIQSVWRSYIRKKHKAVSIIEKHMLHYLYKPGGPLAPICFK